jgi:cell division protein FtsI (penicillin-binding protein 3)
MLAVYNAVANNGVMVKPFLVSEVKEFGKSIVKNKTEILNPKIASEETIKQLRMLLEGVVENGTAKNLKGLEYKVAGKTGTAQIALNSKGYDKSSHKASFVGYFPAENPQYTCIVVINAPANGVYYGGAVAGPVFKEIADKIYSTNINLHSPIAKNNEANIPKTKNGHREDIKFILNKLMISSHVVKGDVNTEWISSYTDGKSIDLKELNTSNQLVPNVVGMGLKDAIYILENRGLKVMVEGYGTIRSQSLSPGSTIYRGTTIYIKLTP